MKVDKEDTEVILELVLEDGYTQSEVSREFGVSRQYIQQIITREYPVGYRDRMMMARKERKHREEREFYVKRDWHCAVCNGLVRRFPKAVPPNPNHFHYTCCHEHAKAWSKLRYVLCEDCHQNHHQNIEATYRKKPEKYARMLSLIDNPNHGTYERSVRRGSLTHQYLLRYRPEVMASLPFADEIHRPQWNGVGPNGYDPKLKMHVQP